MISRLLFAHRCYHGGPLHQFEARFTVIPGSQPVPENIDEILWHCSDGRKPEIISAFHGGAKKLYRGDVCVWCGKVVNEQGTPA